MKPFARLTDPANAMQLEKLQARWERISHRGLAVHTLWTGSALFVWMCACYFGFMYLSGHLQLVRQPFVLYTSLFCFLLLACLAPIAQYWMIGRMVSRIAPTKA